jgi:hypothetical protein
MPTYIQNTYIHTNIHAYKTYTYIHTYIHTYHTARRSRSRTGKESPTHGQTHTGQIRGSPQPGRASPPRSSENRTNYNSHVQQQNGQTQQQNGQTQQQNGQTHTSFHGWTQSSQLIRPYTENDDFESVDGTVNDGYGSWGARPHTSAGIRSRFAGSDLAPRDAHSAGEYGSGRGNLARNGVRFAGERPNISVQDIMHVPGSVRHTNTRVSSFINGCIFFTFSSIFFSPRICTSVLADLRFFFFDLCLFVYTYIHTCMHTHTSQQLFYDKEVSA